MDISTKEIKRVTAHTDLLHYQWADKDAQRQATIAAREVYRKAMAEHTYPLLDDYEPAAVEWLRGAGIRVRRWWLGCAHD